LENVLINVLTFEGFWCPENGMIVSALLLSLHIGRLLDTKVVSSWWHHSWHAVQPI